MPSKTILCIGSPENLHIQEVQKHAKELDKEAKMVIFNLERESDVIIEITTDGNEPSNNCTFIINGERMLAKEITSVWFYPRPLGPPEREDVQGRIGRGFAEKEWQSVFHSLVPFLSHARWLNPLGPLQISKPDQLKLAQEVGLTVPKTTITNHAAAIEKLFDDGRVIFKALSPPFTSTNDMVFTREITREFPSYFQASIAQCPAIYQELVERKSDLRITVVGREVFVVRIASQTLEEEKDRLDWRRKQDKYDIFSQAEISDQLKDRLLEFHKRAGLVYGAYDFLECETDTIFLECNAAGAWLWLERAVGIQVSEQIARYLLGMEETA
ncbi:uncharacterized protein [Acropora muricata]|uniref:uncharacterized protein n=1 Tax=Acropora muricata TaxID=159855 RepID=UPI0034E538C0